MTVKVFGANVDGAKQNIEDLIAGATPATAFIRKPWVGGEQLGGTSDPRADFLATSFDGQDLDGAFAGNNHYRMSGSQGLNGYSLGVMANHLGDNTGADALRGENALQINALGSDTNTIWSFNLYKRFIASDATPGPGLTELPTGPQTDNYAVQFGQLANGPNPLGENISEKASWVGMNWNADDFIAAAKAFRQGDTAPLFRLLDSQSYEFVGRDAFTYKPWYADVGQVVRVNDVFHGYAMDDSIAGNVGDDKLWGRGGDDWIAGNADNDQLYGEAGNDTLIGGDGIDFIDGGANDDWIKEYSNDGVDTIHGGTGTDLLDFRGSTRVAEYIDIRSDVRSENKYGTNTFFSSIENFVGSYRSDVILLSEKDNIDNKVWGYYGEDRLSTGSGNDYIDGGFDNDIIYAGAGADKAYGSFGDDFAFGGAGNDLVSGNDGIDRLYGGADEDRVYGGNDRDFLYGEEGYDQLFGGTGDDYLVGGTENDELDGGIGADALYGGDGLKDIARYFNSVEAVQVRLDLGRGYGGEAQGDAYSGIEGVYGSNAGDIIVGNAVDNYLAGFGGSDWLQGLGGEDTLRGDDGVDYLDGGAGADFLNGGAQFDYAVYLTAKAGVTVNLANAALNKGDAAGDRFLSIEGIGGSNFNDVLTGDAGGNIIGGGLGRDLLTGGAGADAFVFNTALNATTNVDAIADFKASDDVFWLQGAGLFSGMAPGALAASGFQAASAATSSLTRIIYEAGTGKIFYDQDGAGGAAQILFATIKPNAALSAADFLVV
jgi:Ca2+-binding RTX toxin-like protein